MISDIKHYAFNDQESGRQEVDAQIGERAGRESDLLAFEIGVKTGHPDAVMCSYNGVNGDYACENTWLLHDVLKREWKFPGFVMSDWDATHSTVKASHAGLDQEQPLDLFYGAALKKAVESGEVSQAELNDHVRRVLWAEFASGIIDHPVVARRGRSGCMGLRCRRRWKREARCCCGMSMRCCRSTRRRCGRLR